MINRRPVLNQGITCNKHSQFTQRTKWRQIGNPVIAYIQFAKTLQIAGKAYVGYIIIADVKVSEGGKASEGRNTAQPATR